MIRFCIALLLTCLSLKVPAQNVVVQRTLLAGFKYHQAQLLWQQMREGDALTLTHEPTNPYDRQAVRVDWQGQALGYLPRRLNGAVARSLAEGAAITARIKRLRDHPDPRQRIELEILATIQTRPDN